MSTMENEEIMTERPIHPALDLTTNHANVGQWLGQSRSMTSFALIRDDERLLPHVEFSLGSIGLELAHQSFGSEQSWLSESRILHLSKSKGIMKNDASFSYSKYGIHTPTFTNVYSTRRDCF